MNILISDLTDKLDKYETCCELAQNFGKVFIFKNEHPDSVLMPIDEYERLLNAVENSDNASTIDVVEFVKRLPPAGNRKVYTLEQLKNDLSRQ